MDVDSTSFPPRLEPGRVAVEDKGGHDKPLSAPASGFKLRPGIAERASDSMASDGAREFGLSAGHDATSLRVDASPTRRDQPTASNVRASHTLPATSGSLSHSRAAAGPNTASHGAQRQQLPPMSSGNSQDTSSTNDADLVFTPPASEGGMSPGNGSGRDSSQESQLLQLSQIAAAQERIPDSQGDAAGNAAASRKRMADGVVKHTRDNSSASPVRMGGHSRNTSTVSMASNASSRIGELSAELKARLTYAMVKVNHGWQSHTIDQVETLASQAASPTSSTSTIHLRNGASASPQLSNASHRGSNNTTPGTAPQHQFPTRLDPIWRETSHVGSRGSSASPIKPSHTLAPPVSIQPARHLSHPRRNSNPRHAPTFLSNSHQASPNAGPHTPGQPSPYLGSAFQRTPNADPIIFSPHQNVREQDAIESLLFMSSPGNSANLKHAFSSQPAHSNHAAPQRTALPSSQPPRKSLPSGRPTHARSQSHTQKRVGFEKSPRDMDIDESFGTPLSRGTQRRKVNGIAGHGDVHSMPRLKHFPLSTGLTVPTRPRPVLGDAEIDRLLDRAAAEGDSDSDEEIRIPAGRARRDGAHVIGA